MERKGIATTAVTSALSMHINSCRNSSVGKSEKKILISQHKISFHKIMSTIVIVPKYYISLLPGALVNHINMLNANQMLFCHISNYLYLMIL